MHYFWQLFDFIYPPTCCNCGKIGYRLCKECIDKIQQIDESFCLICGEIQKKHRVCIRCKKNPPEYYALRSWGVYNGPLRAAIHSLKYQRNLPLGEFLTDHLVNTLRMQKWEIDLIVPVPLSEKRLKERGFNQADILAKPLSWKTGIPYQNTCIHRVKETSSQVGLTLKDRIINVTNAFEADPTHTKSKTILVVDDVATTGSTINACAQSLIQAGARRVYALTLARTAGMKDN